MISVVIERFWRAFKDERKSVLWPFLPIPVLRRRALAYIRWYNSARPHQGLGGLTPNQVFRGHKPKRARIPAGDLRVRYFGGDHALPIYELKHAA